MHIFFFFLPIKAKKLQTCPALFTCLKLSYISCYFYEVVYAYICTYNLYDDTMIFDDSNGLGHVVDSCDKHPTMCLLRALYIFYKRLQGLGKTRF